MASALSIACVISLAAWIYLLAFRGGFWRADQRLPLAHRPLGRWPEVAVVIPARDEAASIGGAVRSLLGQDYPGRVTLTVVDDGSTDLTAAEARRAGGGSERLAVLTARPPAPGWSGKLWAVQQGLEDAAGRAPETAYWLLTDADIVHVQGALRRLVEKAESEHRHLVSLMVRLRCESAWERLLIPAFVFFFQKLYPFRWVNDPARKVAGAAGGCILVRRSSLEAAGGLDAIRDRLIDDCALAERIKRIGPIWLGLTTGSRSVRAYDDLGAIWRMVARTAFTQLNHAVTMVALTVVAMLIIYLVPPLCVAYGILAGWFGVAALGVAVWALMVVAYRPTLALYQRSLVMGLTLPVAAVLYCAMTIDSAWRGLLGRGAEWKGRAYAPPKRPRAGLGAEGS